MRRNIWLVIVAMIAFLQMAAPVATAGPASTDSVPAVLDATFGTTSTIPGSVTFNLGITQVQTFSGIDFVVGSGDPTMIVVDGRLVVASGKETTCEVGLPAPEPVRVMSAEHQITQKIHACTGPDAASRAHDLVDIQILAAVEDLDYAAIAAIGPRLFAYRQRHEWPPTVVAHHGWDSLYANAREDIDNDTVLAAVSEAVDLVNGIVDRAVSSAR